MFIKKTIATTWFTFSVSIYFCAENSFEWKDRVQEMNDKFEISSKHNEIARKFFVERFFGGKSQCAREKATRALYCGDSLQPLARVSSTQRCENWIFLHFMSLWLEWMCLRNMASNKSQQISLLRLRHRRWNLRAIWNVSSEIEFCNLKWNLYLQLLDCFGIETFSRARFIYIENQIIFYGEQHQLQCRKKKSTKNLLSLWFILMISPSPRE